jgi:hypothetical protein
MKLFKKKGKILAAALAMMTFSTAAAVTGTVAWFTASNVVEATGMSIQADTEQGILISNESKAEWKASIEASHNGQVSSSQAAFIPTSTANGTNWYHANSDDRNNHAAYGGYTPISVGQNGSSGVYAVTTPDLSITNKNVYLLNSFFLRASIPTQVTAPKLYANLVEVTAPSTSNSAELNKSLRVLLAGTVDTVDNPAAASPTVTSKSFVKIFAPLETGEDLKPYTVNGATAITPLNEKNVVLENNVQIPASSNDPAAAALEIKVYVYFEGEDEHCKSANIPAEVLDTLSLKCKFGTETIANA